jgi:hypothetical protein
MSLPTEDFEPETPSGALVHWMGPAELRFGPSALAAAFAAGVAIGLALLAALQAPRARRIPPWRASGGED